MATLGGGWIHPLVGAQYFAPASADGIPIVQKTRAVGSEGRAQNIAPLQVGESTHRPASPYTAVRQAIGAAFFRRSRLFLREAAFFSGGEGCEWGAKQPTVCSEWG